MTPISEIKTSDDLEHFLSNYGLSSEPLIKKSEWEEHLPVYQQSIARHLTCDIYKNLYIAVNSNVLSIHSWIIKICELTGEFSETQFLEKLDLCADPSKELKEGGHCICLDFPLPFDHYRVVRNIGVDTTNGRYGTVTLKECLHCRRQWIHYFLEYEVYNRSGRYYMGVISPGLAENITPETAVEYLNSLEWHLFGGSFFDNQTGRSDKKGIYVD